jgi:hypothetical protein
MMIRAKLLRAILVSVVTVLLAFTHQLYSWWITLRLYELSGGIRKLPNAWTEFGGAKFAWAIPLELPGSVILRLCQIYSKSDCNGTTAGWIGISLMLLPSLIIAYLVAMILTRLLLKQPISLGRYYWRIIVIALGLLWIPVREDFAPVFQYTVAY